MTDSITETLSTNFGVSSAWIHTGIGLAILLAVSLSIYISTRSALLTNIATTLGMLGMGLAGLIPIWMVVPTFAVGGASIAFTFWQPDTDDNGVPIPADGITDYWAEYGLHLKQAYSAKFGGSNSGFDESVDEHIAVMQHNGRGFTRSLANDWLKRMHRFTECK